MLNIIQAEDLKFKRTFSKRLVFLIPLYIPIYALISSTSFGTEYNYFKSNTMNWWCFIFMPLLIAILSSLSTLREEKRGNYRVLKSKSINIRKVWISKIVIIGFYTLLSTLESVIIFISIKLIFLNSINNLLEIVYGCIIIWVTTLLLIPICLFITESCGILSNIIVTLVGIIIEVLIVPTKFWFLWPWSLSMRLMCPILKIHPNGTFLEKNSALLNNNVIFIGVIISIIALVILTYLTSIWFEKKEVN